MNDPLYRNGVLKSIKRPDLFRETGITQAMVDRVVGAWNEGLMISQVRSAMEQSSDPWARDILRQAYACAIGYATRIDASGVRNGYDYRGE